MFTLKLFPKGAITGLLTVIGLLLPLHSPAPARAEEVSDRAVQQYAQAVLEIESHRQQALADITRIIGESPPEIVCNQPRTYRDLPEDAKTIATNYCETSQNIVESTGLSVKEFNQITEQLNNDPNLEQRIQQAMEQMR